MAMNKNVSTLVRLLAYKVERLLKVLRHIVSVEILGHNTFTALDSMVWGVSWVVH